MDIQAIARTLGTDEPNESVQVTLPGAAIEYLLRWAEVGLEKADALPEVAAHLTAIREAADAEVIRTSDQFITLDKFAAYVEKRQEEDWEMGGVWTPDGVRIS